MSLLQATRLSAWMAGSYIYIMFVHEWAYTGGNKENEHVSDDEKKKAPIDRIQLYRLLCAHIGDILPRRRPNVEVSP